MSQSIRVAAIAGILAGCGCGVATADDGVTIGRHATVTGGVTPLHAHSDLPQPIAISPSVFPGFPGYATGLFGFSNAPLDEPEEDLFMLSESADISATLTGLSGGLVIHNGLTVMAPGGAGNAGAMHFGPPYFDYHPLFHLPVGGSGIARFVMHDLSGFYGDSVEVELRFIALNPACPADLGAQGGVHGADGLLDNNDFISFIDYFFESDAFADLGVQGGEAGHDGLFDNNDFIAFIDAFFAAC